MKYLLRICLLLLPVCASGETAEELFNKGRIYLETKRWEEAKHVFATIIDLKPRMEILAPAYLNHGFANEHLGDSDGAIVDYDLAIRTFPDYDEAYAKRAFCYVEMKNYGQGIADANKALLIAPTDIEAFHARALALLSLKDYEKAAHDYTAALAFDPKDVVAYAGRGVCRSRLGDKPGAI